MKKRTYFILQFVVIVYFYQNPILAASEISGSAPSSLQINIKPQCTELSDNFCKKTWLPPLNGNIALKTGNIFLGKTEKSELRMIEKLDLLELIASESRLPKDLRKKSHNILSQLKKHFEKESDADLWYHDLDSIKHDWWNLVRKTAIRRTQNRVPGFTKIQPKERTYDQNWLLKEDYYDLADQIISAKYKNHPNWLRVQSIFEKVKQDVLAEVNNLGLEEAVKKIITTKLLNVKLVFPSEDPRKVSVTAGCGSTVFNAYYMSDRNLFTVCAGFFNSLQDISPITFVLAHEMAHSFDPLTYATDRLLESPTGTVLKKLCHQKESPYDCDEWAKTREIIFPRLKTVDLKVGPFKKLTQCLKKESTLQPFKSDEVIKVNELNRRWHLNAIARRNDFSRLAQATEFKNGKTSPNDYFMRPDRWTTPNSNEQCLMDVDIELMAQVLKCSKYKETDKLTRGSEFESAMKDMEQIQHSLGEQWIQYCGTDCPDLVSSKMSRVVQEEFADWMAKRVVARMLERESDLETRREHFGSLGVWLCDRPGTFWEASDLTEREKKWSFESHPNENIRRLSLITPRIADLIQCTSTTDSTSDINNFCEL